MSDPTLETYLSVDLARDPFLVALDLLYIENHVRLYASKTHLGTPQEIEVTSGNDLDANTYIPVQVMEDSNGVFTSIGGLMYRRYWMKEAQIGTIPAPREPTSLHAMLPLINKFCRLALTPEDVMDMRLTPGNTLIALRAEPTSLVWRGLAQLRQSNALLRKTRLSGFVPYAA